MATEIPQNMCESSDKSHAWKPCAWGGINAKPHESAPQYTLGQSARHPTDIAK